MKLLTILLLVTASLTLLSCKSMEPLRQIPVSPPPNLVQDCDDPAELKEGDSIPMALINNVAALKDCQSRHRQLSEWVNGL